MAMNERQFGEVRERVRQLKAAGLTALYRDGDDWVLELVEEKVKLIFPDREGLEAFLSGVDE